MVGINLRFKSFQGCGPIWGAPRPAFKSLIGPLLELHIPEPRNVPCPEWGKLGYPERTPMRP